MKLNKFAYSKPLRNNTLKIMKNTWKFTLKTWKSHGNISPKKWEPCLVFYDEYILRHR